MIYDIPNGEKSLLQVVDFNGITIEIRSTDIPRQRVSIVRSLLPPLIEALQKAVENPPASGWREKK